MVMRRMLQSRMTQQEALAIRISPLDRRNQKTPAIRRHLGHAHERTGAVMILNPGKLGAAPGVEQSHLKGGGQHPGLMLMNAG